jgi:hypothetical protein
MVLHDVTFHRRDDGARWLGMPARSYTRADGETAWTRIVDFNSKQAHTRFQREAMAAVDKYFGTKKDEAGDQELL